MNTDVILGITAGLMHVVAFYKYHKQVILGISHPPKATFLLWIFLSTLNAISFFVLGEEDWVLTILPAFSTISLFVVFYLFVRKNKLSKLDPCNTIALFLGIIALLAWSWYHFNRIGAKYANLILQFSVAVSFIPLYRGFLKGREDEKGPWPWFIWASAYILQIVLVCLRWKNGYQLFYPINCFFLHLGVGIWSLKKT